MEQPTAISAKPALPSDEAWCLHIGDWDDPDKQVLEGFASSFDAWAFAIAHGLVDPARLIPWKFRQSFNCPKPESPAVVEQMKMEL